MRRGPGLLIIPERGCVCTLRLPSFPTVREGSKWKSETENKEEWIFCTRRFHFLNNSPINSFFPLFRRFDPCFSRGGKVVWIGNVSTTPQVWSRSGNNHPTNSPIVRTPERIACKIVALSKQPQSSISRAISSWISFRPSFDSLSKRHLERRNLSREFHNFAQSSTIAHGNRNYLSSDGIASSKPARSSTFGIPNRSQRARTKDSS